MFVFGGIRFPRGRKASTDRHFGQGPNKWNCNKVEMNWKERIRSSVMYIRHFMC